MIGDLYKIIIFEIYKLNLPNGTYTDSEIILKQSKKQLISDIKYQRNGKYDIKDKKNLSTKYNKKMLKK